MVAPPSEKIAVVLISVLPSLDFSWNVSSRVCLVSWAMRSIAQSRVLSSQWSELGARYLTVFQRRSFTASWKLAAPLGHRLPSLTGESGLPSMLTISPLTVWAIMPQPTAQYGQIVGTARAFWMRSVRAWATVGARLSPNRSEERRVGKGRSCGWCRRAIED